MSFNVEKDRTKDLKYKYKSIFAMIISGISSRKDGGNKMGEIKTHDINLKEYLSKVRDTENALYTLREYNDHYQKMYDYRIPVVNSLKGKHSWNSIPEKRKVETQIKANQYSI